MSGATQIRRETLQLPMARLGAPSNLPRFRAQQPTPNRPTPPNFGLNPEESAHGFNWGEESILPYQVTDDYDRDRRDAALDVVVLDNGRLRAVIAPSLGGRLLELKDLATGRDLVFRNPVFQPANLASLNAWFSGGIEWNGLIPGHTPFTCAPVFAGMRDTPDGPILRIYEFDRIVEATWQVDLFLPAGSSVLYAHGRIANANDTDRLAYWWTNIAAPMHDRTRVLSPADYSIEHIWPGNNLGRCEFPRPDWDASYPDNWQNATSVFFRAPQAKRRFIAALDAAGHGLVQTSTREMAGRKFFYFGTAQGGRNWMDFLSRPGEGKYLEIQSGIARTQNQRFVLPARSELEWTEAFAPLAIEPGQAHDPDYGAAVANAAAALDRLVPQRDLADIDAFLRAAARGPLEARFSEGSPWGTRQEALLGRSLAEGLDFNVSIPGDCWDDLAAGLVIAEPNLQQVPQGIVVSGLWTERVAESAEAHGNTWLHSLILAMSRLDQGDITAATAHLRQSLALKPTWLGHRLMALAADGTAQKSASYRDAWRIGGAPPELAVEIAAHFMSTDRPEELKAFVDSLPAGIRDNERIVLARTVVAVNAREFDEAERLLMSRQYAGIREGETLLSDLWRQIRRGRLEARLGRPPDAVEIAEDLSAHPLPRELDLRMHALDEG